LKALTAPDFLPSKLSTSFTQNEVRDLQAAARILGMDVPIVGVAAGGDVVGSLATAFAEFAEKHVVGVLVSSNFIFQRERSQVVALAARYGLATMFADVASVEAGALSSYGPDFADAYHHAGVYSGRILKGEKPSDLPVVQPTRFELVLNLKTAKGIGLDIPPTVLALADRGIE
jgi:putative ABC transport system substrate-binding protein